MENPYNNLVSNINNYLVKSQTKSLQLQGSRLIRIHNEKLSTGDVSFPYKPEIWAKYFPAAKGFVINEDAFKYLNENVEGELQFLDFLEEAKTWTLPVMRLRLDIAHERCHLHLQRGPIIQNIMQRVLCNSQDYGRLRKSPELKVYLMPFQEYGLKPDDLSFKRAQILYQTLQKLLTYSRWSVEQNLQNDEATLKLQVLSVASKIPEIPPSSVPIKCGLVTDPQTRGKICTLPAGEYLSLRSNDMCLMALHKYGVRVKQDARFCDLMDRLGCAAVTVDLLEVKHSSPVQIIRNGQGSTKGASFILYNSARLESLLRSFEERIERRAYEPLPELCDVDWSLLNEEEEWQLVFVYLTGFPDLIDSCLEQLEKGLCSTHLIIRFLHGLVAIFSVYYRRVRILTEKRDQLMPYVYARMYLVRAVREVLNKTLALLDIQPVEFM